MWVVLDAGRYIKHNNWPVGNYRWFECTQLALGTSYTGAATSLLWDAITRTFMAMNNMYAHKHCTSLQVSVSAWRVSFYIWEKFSVNYICVISSSKYHVRFTFRLPSSWQSIVTIGIFWYNRLQIEIVANANYLRETLSTRTPCPPQYASTERYPTKAYLQHPVYFFTKFNCYIKFCPPQCSQDAIKFHYVDNSTFPQTALSGSQVVSHVHSRAKYVSSKVTTTRRVIPTYDLLGG